MKKGELTIGKWHFKLGIIPNHYSKIILVHFGIFKLLKHPPEGWPYKEDYYKGFWWRKDWTGFEINV